MGNISVISVKNSTFRKFKMAAASHDVPVAGFYVTCQWRNDQLEFFRDIMILSFRDFGWNMPIPTNFGAFGGDFDPLKL